VTRGRRAVAVAVLLIAAGIISYVQLNRIGGEVPSGLPPDTPPAGVAVFYVRDPANPHALIAYDWSGTRRGSVRLPTWVEIARLQPAPDGSAFLVDPAMQGDYAAYFDRAGRTTFETDDPGFFSQAWADDSAHVCVLTDRGLVTRVPGQPDRPAAPAGGGEYTVSACSVRSDTAVLASTDQLQVVRLSNGRTLRTLATGGPAVVSVDATYVALSQGEGASVVVYRTSDTSAPAATLDAGLQPLAFSGDDSLLLTTQPGGEVKGIVWRTGRVAWRYDASNGSVGLVWPRPSAADFVLYLSTGPVLVRRDGRTARFA
jgi:hypothetical protein